MQKGRLFIAVLKFVDMPEITDALELMVDPTCSASVLDDLPKELGIIDIQKEDSNDEIMIVAELDKFTRVILYIADKPSNHRVFITRSLDIMNCKFEVTMIINHDCYYAFVNEQLNADTIFMPSLNKLKYLNISLDISIERN